MEIVTKTIVEVKTLGKTNKGYTVPTNITDENLDVDFTEYSLPVICVQGAIILIGIILNSVVISSYRKQFRKYSFILSLAIVDLVNCLNWLFTIPQQFGIIDTEVKTVLQTIQLFVLYTGNLLSAMLVAVIALDRFQKVSKPQKLWSVRKNTDIIYFVVLLAILMSFPIVLLMSFGTNISVHHRNKNAPEHISIENATLADDKNNGLAEIMCISFYGFVLTFMLVVWIYIVVIYSKLGQLILEKNRLISSSVVCLKEQKLEQVDIENGDVLKRQYDYHKNNNDDTIDDALTATKADTKPAISLISEAHHLKLSRIIQSQSQSLQQVTSTQTFHPNKLNLPYKTNNNISSETEIEDTCIRHKRPQKIRDKEGPIEQLNVRKLALKRIGSIKSRISMSMDSKTSDQQHSTSRRTSAISVVTRHSHVTYRRTIGMLILAIVLFLFHFPYLCTNIISILAPCLKFSFKTTSRALYSMTEHSYMFLYVLNPILYSFFNRGFRQNLTRSLRIPSRNSSCLIKSNKKNRASGSIDKYIDTVNTKNVNDTTKCTQHYPYLQELGKRLGNM